MIFELAEKLPPAEVFERVVESMDDYRTQSTGIVTTAFLNQVGRQIARIAGTDRNRWNFLAHMWRESAVDPRHLVFGVTTGREIRLAVISALGALVRKNPEFVRGFIPEVVHHIPDWETCDQLALKVFKPLLLGDFDSTASLLREYIADSDRWVRRIPVATVAFYVKAPDANLPFCFEIVGSLLADDDRDVKKAVEWALREMGKVYPREVFDFLRFHLKSGEIPLSTARNSAKTLPSDLKRNLFA